MSGPKAAGTGSSREKDHIYEIFDQIERVGGSLAGRCAPVSALRSRNRRAPPGAFDVLAANPTWSCRYAARELGVSVGVVHRWRSMIAVGDRPRDPGRPKTPPERREVEQLQRRFRLVLQDPRRGLVRNIQRILRNARELGLDEIRELHCDLFQTSYGLVTGADGHPEGAPIDPRSIIIEALGNKNGRLFLDYVGVRAFGRAKEDPSEPDADPASNTDAPSAYEAQIHERAFQAQRSCRRARRRGR